MPKVSKESFRNRIEGVLKSLGASRTPSLTSVNRWRLKTQIGAWDFAIFDDWVATKFANIEEASKLTNFINEFTGKYNLHFTGKSSKEAGDLFERDVRSMLDSIRTRKHKPNPTATVSGTKRLEDRFDPDSIEVGVYEVSSTSDAYPPARFLVESGRGRSLAEQFFPDGHILLTFEVGPRQNPDEGEERTVAVKMTRKWLESRTREYRDWRTAWWREAIQNSIDPGTGAATQVDLICKEGPDGNWIVSCSDNGRGMTREQVEDEERGFLSFGGSGKGSGSSIGGFGEAKQLLIFPWIQYRLVTSDQEYIGKGNVAKAKTVPPRTGVLLEVIMPADFHATPEDAESVLSKSWIPHVTFTLNGKVIKTGAPTPDVIINEVPGEGIVYEAPRRKKSPATIAREQEALPGTKIDKFEPTDILVRKDGLWMFSEDLASGAKHGLIVEVTGKSTEMFTTNRDGFNWKASKIRKLLDKARNEVASEGKVRSRKEKPVEMIVRGTGKFSTVSELPARTMKVQEALGPLPEVSDANKGVQLGDKAIEMIASQIASFNHEDVGYSSSASEAEKAILETILVNPETIKAIFQSMAFKGQKTLDAAIKQMVWKPDFFLLKDEGLKFNVPAKFNPEKMTPAVLRLLKTWAELCRFALITYGLDALYGVGFWFSPEYEAGYLWRSNEHWLLLDPHVSKSERKEIFNPNDADDLRHLWSLALHEVAHMIVRSRYSSMSDDDDSPPVPASHGQDYASVLTSLHEKLADAWPKVKKIAASIKMRRPTSERPPEKPAEKERVEEQEPMNTDKLARRLVRFIELFHVARTKWMESGVAPSTDLLEAYDDLRKGLLTGLIPDLSMSDHELRKRVEYLVRTLRLFDEPMLLNIKSVSEKRYNVSVTFDCWGFQAEKCDAVETRIRDTWRLMEYNDDVYSLDHLMSFNVGGEIPSDATSYIPNPVPNPNPCACNKGKTQLHQEYKEQETSAQRSAAAGDLNAARAFKERARSILREAREKKEPWSVAPSLYPSVQPRSFDDFDWKVISGILDAEFLKEKRLSYDGKHSRLHAVDIQLRNGQRLRITDNGGEVNLSWIDSKGKVVGEAIGYSVPYWSNAVAIRNVTLAYRLKTALEGGTIDYDLGLD